MVEISLTLEEAVRNDKTKWIFRGVDINMVERCKICGVCVSSLSKHLERKRCEAVKFRREWRKEIKSDNSIGKGNVLGVRGKRTLKRNRGGGKE